MRPDELDTYKKLPSEYPQDLNKNDILGYINSLEGEIKRVSNPANVTKIATFIQLGKFELDSRSAKKSNWISIGIAVLALLIALGGFFTSVRWEQGQIKVLEDINTNIEQVIQNQSE